MENRKVSKNISKSIIRRLPLYLKYLRDKKKSGITYIGMPQIAVDFEKNPMQVKKDIANVITKSGKPKVGHLVDDLINDIESFLGYDQTTYAVLVGVGNLGTALLSYRGFNDYGLEIIEAFDSDERIVGKKINGVPIFSIKDMELCCKKDHILIGIIAVSEQSAQEVCDLLVKSGIKAIWNFSPVYLKVPSDVIIQSENMASGLAYLSHRLFGDSDKRDKD